MDLAEQACHAGSMTSKLFLALENAGLTDEDGALGRPRLPVSKCVAPEGVALSPTREYLVWTPSGHRRDSLGALDAFLEIETPGEVWAFAERFGVLGLCEHRLPSSHAKPCKPGFIPFTDDRIHGEPVDSWLRFVGAAKATLALAAAAHDNRTGDLKDWTEVHECLFSEASDDLRQFLTAKASEGPPRESRLSVASFVYRWLELGDVRPTVSWDSAHPELLLSSAPLTPPLFGVLASQLALAVARANVLAQCSGCSRLYARPRKPQRGRRNYCNTCRKNGVPARDAQRTWREEHPNGRKEVSP